MIKKNTIKKFKNNSMKKNRNTLNCGVFTFNYIQFHHFFNIKKIKYRKNI